jgi:hypothetical protein
MQAPCEENKPGLCRYLSRGADFEFVQDKLARIKLSRPGRVADSGKTYGSFNGAIPPDIRFGMLPWAVAQVLGPPRRVEKPAVAGVNRTLRADYYDGIVIEYDQLDNGNLIFSGVRIPE